MRYVIYGALAGVFSHAIGWSPSDAALVGALATLLVYLHRFRSGV